MGRVSNFLSVTSRIFFKVKVQSRKTLKYSIAFHTPTNDIMVVKEERLKNDDIASNPEHEQEFLILPRKITLRPGSPEVKIETSAITHFYEIRRLWFSGTKRPTGATRQSKRHALTRMFCILENFPFENARRSLSLVSFIIK